MTDILLLPVQDTTAQTASRETRAMRQQRRQVAAPQRTTYLTVRPAAVP
jgi:hypothetical protein